MEKISLKEAFGKETEMTKFIANDKETLIRLFDECGIYSDFSEENAQIETLTEEGKRVDITVTTNRGENIVIEQQDAKEEVDPHHISKTVYYMFDQQATVGIVLCGTSTEKMRSYTRFLNESSNIDLFLVEYLIIQDSSKNKLIGFKAIVKPYEPKDKAKLIARASKQPKSTLFNNISLIINGEEIKGPSNSKMQINALNKLLELGFDEEQIASQYKSKSGNYNAVLSPKPVSPKHAENGFIKNVGTNGWVTSTNASKDCLNKIANLKLDGVKIELVSK